MHTHELGYSKYLTVKSSKLAINNTIPHVLWAKMQGRQTKS